MKVIFDMDPGIDDAIALLLALNNPNLDIVAVTTVSGNVNLSLSTTNALKVMELVNKNIPVYAGSKKPLIKKPFHTDVHGRDGLGDLMLPKPKLRAGTNAIDALDNFLRDEKIIIIATAPLTNLALLFKKDPEIFRDLKIYIMGGAYGLNVKGNVTEFAEYNFYCDPEAANIIMSSSAQITALGLDVTSERRCAINKDILEKIHSIDSNIANAAYRILRYAVERYEYFNLHDVFALFSLLYPEIFNIHRHNVRVYTRGRFRGKCIVTPGDTKICKEVNYEKFNMLLLDGLK